MSAAVEPFTICFVYFKSLTLANLSASLYSVRQQALDDVAELVVVDNDTPDSTSSIQAVVDALDFPVPVRWLSCKHGDGRRSHAWSSNVAIREARTDWLLFTRADYLLDRALVSKLLAARQTFPPGWDGFVTANGYHLTGGVPECEATAWRRDGAHVLRECPGAEYDYSVIDTGVWMSRRAAWERVEGLDETLTAWGHAQTYFQHQLHESGVEFFRVPEVLFYHPMHAGERDMTRAHAQLRELGVDIRHLWARYHGAPPY